MTLFPQLTTEQPTTEFVVVDNSQPPLIVFVPGFLGSTLVEERSDGSVQEVWGENLFSNARLVVSSVRRLNSQEISPGSILRTLQIGKRRQYEVYGQLLDFFSSPEGLALQRYNDFFPFPYDWRRSVIDIADDLERFVNRIDGGGRRRIAFVAHSMGGLVVRALLARFPAIHQRTQLLFQIASPVAGTQKAYGCLRDRFRFCNPLDFLLDAFYKGNPDAHADFREVALSFESLYEMLPYKEDTLINVDTGSMASALSPGFWPLLARPLLEKAKITHAILSEPLTCHIECVYSDCHDTLCHHYVSEDGTVKRWKDYPVGDGTVIDRSAYEGSENGRRRCRQGKSTTHIALCSNNSVLKLLRESLERTLLWK